MRQIKLENGIMIPYEMLISMSMIIADELKRQGPALTDMVKKAENPSYKLTLPTKKYIN